MSYLILCFLVLFIPLSFTFSFFFFNDTATTEIYTLSLHDALPIFPVGRRPARRGGLRRLDQWLFLLCALQGSEAQATVMVWRAVVWRRALAIGAAPPATGTSATTATA